MDRPAAEDSDRIHCVMHGKRPEMTRNTPEVSRIDVVKFLHPVLAEDRARTGFGLTEVIVAVTVCAKRANGRGGQHARECPGGDTGTSGGGGRYGHGRSWTDRNPRDGEWMAVGRCATMGVQEAVERPVIPGGNG
jgi:hypothetical protein